MNDYEQRNALNSLVQLDFSLGPETKTYDACNISIIFCMQYNTQRISYEIS